LVNFVEPQRLVLIGLLAFWAIFLFGGFIFGKENTTRTHRIPTLARMASSLTLVVAGWSWLIFVNQSFFTQLALFIAIGMSLGFVGDLFLANLISVGNPILGGIGAFGLGHIAYIIGLVSYGNLAGLDDPGIRWSALAVCLLIGAIAWYLVVYRGKQHTTLHLAALPYSLLLSTTVGISTSLAVQMAEFIPLALGAGLFLVSDLILAAQLFNHTHFRLIGDVVWLTYGPGQMLIVFAFALPMMI
jgi:hypothetical protein